MKILKFINNNFNFFLLITKKYLISQTQIKDGVVAQLVEQWTENPCVTGSIPVDATKKGLVYANPFFVN